MNRTLTCIICPRGCTLTVSDESGEPVVTGQTCPRGKTYGIEECTHPVRTVTSSIRVGNRTNTMVSVKTSHPIAKEDIFAAMAQIRHAVVNAPIRREDVLLHNVCGADMIATCDVD